MAVSTKTCTCVFLHVRSILGLPVERSDVPDDPKTAAESAAVPWHSWSEAGCAYHSPGRTVLVCRPRILRQVRPSASQMARRANPPQWKSRHPHGIQTRGSPWTGPGCTFPSQYVHGHPKFSSFYVGVLPEHPRRKHFRERIRSRASSQATPWGVISLERCRNVRNSQKAGSNSACAHVFLHVRSALGLPVERSDVPDDPNTAAESAAVPWRSRPNTGCTYHSPRRTGPLSLLRIPRQIYASATCFAKRTVFPYSTPSLSAYCRAALLATSGRWAPEDPGPTAHRHTPTDSQPEAIPSDEIPDSHESLLTGGREET